MRILCLICAVVTPLRSYETIVLSIKTHVIILWPFRLGWETYDINEQLTVVMGLNTPFSCFSLLLFIQLARFRNYTKNVHLPFWYQPYCKKNWWCNQVKNEQNFQTHFWAGNPHVIRYLVICMQALDRINNCPVKPAKFSFGKLLFLVCLIKQHKILGLVMIAITP